MGVSVCGPALGLSRRVLHTHCYAANCFVLSFQHIKSVPHYPTQHVLQGVMCEFAHVNPLVYVRLCGKVIVNMFWFLYLCMREPLNEIQVYTARC